MHDVAECNKADTALVLPWYSPGTGLALPFHCSASATAVALPWHCPAKAMLQSLPQGYAVPDMAVHMFSSTDHVYKRFNQNAIRYTLLVLCTSCHSLKSILQNSMLSSSDLVCYLKQHT